MSTATIKGATVISVAATVASRDGQTVVIGAGSRAETAIIARMRTYGISEISVTRPLVQSHEAVEQLSGTGITFAAGLTQAPQPAFPLSTALYTRSSQPLLQQSSLDEAPALRNTKRRRLL